jgi:hypothetical protein
MDKSWSKDNLVKGNPKGDKGKDGKGKGKDGKGKDGKGKLKES